MVGPQAPSYSPGSASAPAGGPGQFLGLGDGCGEKLGFKGWLGGVGDLLYKVWPLSSNLLCCDLRKETAQG